jgi:hypothetical protein
MSRTEFGPNYETHPLKQFIVTEFTGKQLQTIDYAVDEYLNHHDKTVVDEATLQYVAGEKNDKERVLDRIHTALVVIHQLGQKGITPQDIHHVYIRQTKKRTGNEDWYYDVEWKKDSPLIQKFGDTPIIKPKKPPVQKTADDSKPNHEQRKKEEKLRRISAQYDAAKKSGAIQLIKSTDGRNVKVCVHDGKKSIEIDPRTCYVPPNAAKPDGGYLAWEMRQMIQRDIQELLDSEKDFI